MRVSRSEEGLVSALVVALAGTFIACAALAFDGGRLIATYVQISDHAGNAARRGVQEVTSLRSGDPLVDGDRARQAVRQYLSLNGLSGDVIAEERAVTVTVTATVRMSILGVIGVGDQSVSVYRTAVPSTGP
jgi:Flp pilus assembly protein TadG